MQALTMNEINMIGGGITETQCISAFALAGGVIGGAATASATWGLGTTGGWGLGMGLGGSFGALTCAWLLEM